MGMETVRDFGGYYSGDCSALGLTRKVLRPLESFLSNYCHTPVPPRQSQRYPQNRENGFTSSASASFRGFEDVICKTDSSALNIYLSPSATVMLIDSFQSVMNELAPIGDMDIKSCEDVQFKSSLQMMLYRDPYVTTITFAGSEDQEAVIELTRKGIKLRLRYHWSGYLIEARLVCFRRQSWRKFAGRPNWR